MSSPPPSDDRPQDVERYARSAAAALGLSVHDDWWPGVTRHLGVLLSRAASLESFDMNLPDDLAPVFQP